MLYCRCSMFLLASPAGQVTLARHYAALEAGLRRAIARAEQGKALLTPEQRAKLVTLLQEGRERAPHQKRISLLARFSLEPPRGRAERRLVPLNRRSWATLDRGSDRLDVKGQQGPC